MTPPGPGPARLRRRRAAATTAVLAAGAAAVLALGWDDLVVLWRAGRFGRDPRALSRAVFLERGTLDARAALVCLGADELEARFAAEVAGREWRVSAVGRQTILPAPRFDSSLSFERLVGGYGVDFERIAHHGSTKTTTIESRLVELRGPFLVDLDTPGRADTWGVAGGRLVLPALARVGEHAWLSVWSRRGQCITVHSFEFFEFDDGPEAGTEGACRYAGFYNSREPVLGRLREVLAGDLRSVHFRAEPGEDACVNVRIATNPETTLVIDPRMGTGYTSIRLRGGSEGAPWTRVASPSLDR